MTADAAGLCLKSRQRRDPARRQGGDPLQPGDGRVSCSEELERRGLPAAAVQVIATTDREAVLELLQLEE